MSRIIANNIRHNDATVDNITLDSAGNVNVPNDLAVDTDTLFVDASADSVGFGTTAPGDYYLSEVVTLGGDGHGITIASSTTSASGRLYFADGTTGDARYRGAISYDHSADALSFDTAAGERMRLLSGGGLTFNGDTASANALDDYEEGTWTPTWGGTSTYATQIGRYTKVGNKVTIWFSVRCTLIGTGGSVTLSGLPFGTASTVDAAIPLAYWQNINSNAYWLTAYAPGGGYTGLYFMGQQGLDASQEVNLSVGKSSAFITGSGTYLVP